jgi:hypothetical protein
VYDAAMPMRLFSLLAAVALAACTPQPKPAPQPTSPTLTAIAPETRDPGVVEDKRPLQEGPPPTGSGSAGAGAGSDIVRGETGKPDGSQCLLSTECASNECEGQGCSNDKPGTCAPSKRMCTRDRRSYCGCDGKSFFASGTCPGRRYAARNACGS